MRVMMSLSALCLAFVLAGCATTEDAASASPGAMTECPVDCTSPCCAPKTCGPDCTKPCCADKDANLGAIGDGEAKTCPFSSGASLGAVSESTCSVSRSACCTASKKSAENTDQ